MKRMFDQQASHMKQVIEMTSARIQGQEHDKTQLHFQLQAMGALSFQHGQQMLAQSAMHPGKIPCFRKPMAHDRIAGVDGRSSAGSPQTHVSGVLNSLASGAAGMLNTPGHPDVPRIGV